MLTWEQVEQWCQTITAHHPVAARHWRDHDAALRAALQQKMDDWADRVRVLAETAKERDKLRAENERLKEDNEEYDAKYAEVKLERDGLRAQVEALTRDKQYHMDCINKLAKHVGQLGETSMTVIDSAIAQLTANQQHLEAQQQATYHAVEREHVAKRRVVALEEALNIDRLVNRFLAWPLPDSVCSDVCATKQNYPHRSGTTLLSAVEAKMMIEHILQQALTKEAT